MKSGIYWNLGIAVISIVIAGSLNNFHLLDKVDFFFHDSYISVAPWQMAILIFIPTAFIVFFFLLIKSKFRYQRTISALLIHNTFAIAMTVYVFYVAYASITIDALVDFFHSSKLEQLITKRFIYIVVTFTLIIIPLVLNEFWLIARLKRLNSK